MMSSCCTLRLKRRRAFSRDSHSCSRISAKQTHPQTGPEGPSSYYKELTGSQAGSGESCRGAFRVGGGWSSVSPGVERRPDHCGIGVFDFGEDIEGSIGILIGPLTFAEFA